MEKTHRMRGALLGFALLCLLSGCAAKKETEPTAAESTARTNDDATVSTLEETLLREREERYISESAYKAEIWRLEAELAELNGAVGAVTDASPEALIFRYRVENGGAVVTGYDGNAVLLTIPAELDGYPVTAIGERAFEDSEVVAVTLSEGVVSVGWFAFYGCRSLVSVTLPRSVSSIGYAVFDGCAKLTLCCPEDSYAAQYARSYGIAHTYI